jgi:hypothetical protein
VATRREEHYYIYDYIHHGKWPFSKIQPPGRVSTTIRTEITVMVFVDNGPESGGVADRDVRPADPVAAVHAGDAAEAEKGVFRRRVPVSPPRPS